MPQNRMLSTLLAVVGVLLLVLAVVYAVEPAKSLPGFLPGHDATLTRHHVTHAVAAAVIGLVALLGAWMVSPRPNARTV